MSHVPASNQNGGGECRLSRQKLQQENADYTDDDEIAELPDATSGGGSSLQEAQHAGAFRVVHSPPQIKPRKFVRDIRKVTEQWAASRRSTPQQPVKRDFK
jgi:hypothetical protein